MKISLPEQFPDTAPPSKKKKKVQVPLCLLICKGNTPSRKRWSQEWHQVIVSLRMLNSHSRLPLSLWTSSDAVKNAKDRTIWPWTEKINNRWITRLAHWSFAMLISTAFLIDYLSSLWGISKNRLYWGTWKFRAQLKCHVWLWSTESFQIFMLLLLSSVLFLSGSQRLLKDKGLLWGASGDTPKCTVRLLISQGHLRHAASDQTPGEVR